MTELDERNQKLLKEFEDLIWSKIKSDMSNVRFEITNGQLNLSNWYWLDRFIITNKTNQHECSLQQILRYFIWANDIDQPAAFEEVVLSVNFFMPKIDVAHLSRNEIGLISNNAAPSTGAGAAKKHNFIKYGGTPDKQ